MGITDGRDLHHHHQQLQHRNNQLQPFGMFDSMFGNMFKNMRNMMADVQRGFVSIDLIFRIVSVVPEKRI